MQGSTTFLLASDCDNKGAAHQRHEKRIGTLSIVRTSIVLRKSCVVRYGSAATAYKNELWTGMRVRVAPEIATCAYGLLQTVTSI